MGRAGCANIAGRLSSSSKAQKGVGRSAEKCEFPDDWVIVTTSYDIYVLALIKMIKLILSLIYTNGGKSLFKVKRIDNKLSKINKNTVRGLHATPS